MKSVKTVLAAVIVASLGVITAVSWHSVEEIHYLKTFYPRSFTVEEAFWASLVELVKVYLVALPLVITILLCLYIIRSLKKEP